MEKYSWRAIGTAPTGKSWGGHDTSTPKTISGTDFVVQVGVSEAGQANPRRRVHSPSTEAQSQAGLGMTPGNHIGRQATTRETTQGRRYISTRRRVACH